MQLVTSMDGFDKTGRCVECGKPRARLNKDGYFRCNECLYSSYEPNLADGHLSSINEEELAPYRRMIGRN